LSLVTGFLPGTSLETAVTPPLILQVAHRSNIIIIIIIIINCN
jgi:hypothetical protein